MNKAQDRCRDSTRELTYDLLYQQQDPASFLQVPFSSSSRNTPTFRSSHLLLKYGPWTKQLLLQILDFSNFE